MTIRVQWVILRCCLSNSCALTCIKLKFNIIRISNALGRILDIISLLEGKKPYYITL